MLKVIVFLFILLTPSCYGAQASKVPTEQKRVTQTLADHEKRLEEHSELLKGIAEKVDRLSTVLEKHHEF